MMAEQRGVGGYESSKTTETFTLDQTNKKIDLEISHNFFKRTSNDGTPTQNHIGCSVRVKNVGNVNLIDVKVHVDVDDDMPAFDAQIYATEQHPSGTLGSNQAILHFGNLSAGATSVKQVYWWTVVPKFPGAKGSKERTARFNLYPTFTVEYSQGGDVFVSEASVANA